jgi:hypothetical protein
MSHLAPDHPETSLHMRVERERGKKREKTQKNFSKGSGIE